MLHAVLKRSVNLALLALPVHLLRHLARLEPEAGPSVGPWWAGNYRHPTGRNYQRRSALKRLRPFARCIHHDVTSIQCPGGRSELRLERFGTLGKRQMLSQRLAAGCFGQGPYYSADVKQSPTDAPVPSQALLHSGYWHMLVTARISQLQDLAYKYSCIQVPYLRVKLAKPQVASLTLAQEGKVPSQGLAEGRSWRT